MTLNFKHYPLGSFSGQLHAFTVQYPQFYDPTKKYPCTLIGHGIGECNDGTLAGITRNYNHGLWGDSYREVGVKYKAALKGHILVFVNTKSTSHYRNKEFQWTKDWAKVNLPLDPNNIGVLVHSLGGYGLFNFAMTDLTFAKDINFVIHSANGGFPDVSPIYKIMVDNNMRCWGITGLQDTVSGYRHVEKVYTGMKALRSDAKAIVTIYPNGEFQATATQSAAQVCHNGVLGRITASPNRARADCTKGIPVGEIQMDIYDWINSNPKGSIYQPPTLAYTGPKFATDPVVPTPTPTPTEKVLRFIQPRFDPAIPQSIIMEFLYENGSADIRKAALGDRMPNAFLSLKGKSAKLNYINKTDEVVYW